MNTNLAFDNSPHYRRVSEVKPSFASSNDIADFPIVTNSINTMINEDVTRGGARRVSEVTPSVTSSSGCLAANKEENRIDSRDESSSSSSVEDMRNMFMFTKFAFPFKLHHLLEHAQKSDRSSSIISWMPSGQSFKIHKPKEFAAVIMPQYFNQTKYRSFQRQLYIYGFDRIRDQSNEEVGAYFHELFVRGAAELCLDMTRKKVKGTGLSNDKRRLRNAKGSPKAGSLGSVNNNNGGRRRLSRAVTNNINNGNGNGGPLVFPPSLFQAPNNSRGNAAASSCQSRNAAATAAAILQSDRLLPSVQQKIKASAAATRGGRRCSLGFMHATSGSSKAQMGRRQNSLLFEGEEVDFWNKKFHFMTGY